MANTKCYALRQISKIRAFSSSASLSLKEHSPTIFHTRWWFFSCFVVDIPGMFTFLAVSLRCVGYKRFSILDCPERTKDQLNYLRVGAKTPPFPTDLERKSKFCIILFIILFKLGDRIITVCLPT